MNSFGVLFGRLIREKRGIEGLSQDRLSAKTGLTKARISDIETGKIANPQIKTVDALCVALDISRGERAGCHPASASGLPARLLEKLARQFDADMPEATEEELEAFLMAKAEEFRAMRERLQRLAAVEGRIAEFLNAANAALGEGHFETADDLLTEAEAVQMQSNTIVALSSQAELRIERGKVALVNGDIGVAAGHFERSSQYFSGIDTALEAENRHECAMQLRYYAYRYKNAEALYQAKTALEQNLHIWQENESTDRWCQTKNALGGTSWRLSQFDIEENARAHLADAKLHYENVRARCSAEFLPEAFATAGLDLANIYSDRKMAASDAEYKVGLQTALKLQLSALQIFSKTDTPRVWGIVHHNLACAYIALSRIRSDKDRSIADAENAIRHAEVSLEVRNPEDSLQYWLASCRTLGEALLILSAYSVVNGIDQHARRAEEVLRGAAAKISASEHPHQWAQIQEQLSQCGRALST